jgi:uncharacterized protein YkvS
MKMQLNEVQKLQKIAGILKEDEQTDIENIKVGAILNFKDGEVWRVTKITPKGVLAKPHDENTKKHNVSIEIEMSNDYIKKHIK